MFTKKFLWHYTILKHTWQHVGIYDCGCGSKMSTDMKLYVFGGDEYSVSIDPESLQILVSMLTIERS